MSNKEDKARLSENIAKVRELFVLEWDPIGVADMEENPDEYDTYVLAAYDMLMHQDATAQQIAAYLFNIASEYMGLGNPPGLRGNCERTADLLLLMKPGFMSA